MAMADVKPSASAPQNKIPHHLRYFLRPALTTERISTQAPYSYTLPTPTTRTSSAELCPPHWRLPPRRSLRHILRDVLLKEWPHSSTPRATSPNHQRPSIMRMKDSDDYITARAANPRTGLISPSIGSETPLLTWTPETPGEALKVAVIEVHRSPTLDIKTRPALRRANEGRKLSAGSADKWRAGENGWVVETKTHDGLAAPKVAKIEAEAGLVTYKSEPTLHHEDSFVMHMPSAREPQPFAYPGYSARQSEAFEHYKRKTRKVSNEGYDQRIVGSRQASGGHAGRDIPQVPSGDIRVAKRRRDAHGPRDQESEMPCSGGADLDAASFAPFASPRTPAMRSNEELGTALKTMPQLHQHGTCSTGAIQRKPVGSMPKTEKVSASHHNQEVSYSRGHSTQPYVDNDNHTGMPADLRHLPRVKLVHPASASLPESHSTRLREGARQCSLGCTQDSYGGLCVKRRLTPTAYEPSARQSLFASAPDGQARRKTTEQRGHTAQVFETLVAAIITILESCRYIPLPSLPYPGVLQVLKAEHATPQQKVDALKSIVSSTGQALVLLAVVAILWQVGSAVMRLFEIMLWPLSLHFRILRWLAAGG